jgi:EamA domain-containing membrane protein RarD
MAALIEHVEEASQTIQLVRNNHQLFMIYRASKNMKLQLYGYLYTVTNTMSVFIYWKLGPSW